MSRDEASTTLGRLQIDHHAYEVCVDGERVALTLKQFRILATLAKRPGWVHDAQQLSRSLDGPGHELSVGTLKNHMYHLRRKLGSAGDQLQTVRGLGYRLVEQQHTPTQDATTHQTLDAI